MKYLSLTLIFLVALLVTDKDLNWVSHWIFKTGVFAWAIWLQVMILKDKTK